jgi:hypothetical protein
LDCRADAIDAYHGDLREVVETPGEPVVARPDGGCLPESDPDLTLVSAGDSSSVDRSVSMLTVHPHDRNRPGRLRRLLERLTF